MAEHRKPWHTSPGDWEGLQQGPHLPCRVDLCTPQPASIPTEESNKKHPFPCPTTYRTALTYYLDITNPPRTNVLYELAQYATAPTEQEQLRKMASSSGEGKVGVTPAPQPVHPWPHSGVQLRSPRLPFSPGAVPELGSGVPAPHPGHPAGLSIPTATHRPPV